MGIILLPDPLLFPYLQQAEQYRLNRINVSRELIKDILVGLRPFRRSGFLVKAELLEEKTLIHNYGHGGCGVTLSWGTSKLAMDIAMESTHRDCAVIQNGAWVALHMIEALILQLSLNHPKSFHSNILKI